MLDDECLMFTRTRLFRLLYDDPLQ